MDGHGPGRHSSWGAWPLIPAFQPARRLSRSGNTLVDGPLASLLRTPSVLCSALLFATAWLLRWAGGALKQHMGLLAAAASGLFRNPPQKDLENHLDEDLGGLLVDRERACSKCPPCRPRFARQVGAREDQPADEGGSRNKRPGEASQSSPRRGCTRRSRSPCSMSRASRRPTAIQAALRRRRAGDAWLGRGSKVWMRSNRMPWSIRRGTTRLTGVALNSPHDKSADKRQSLETKPISRGTESSNPSPSSRQSVSRGISPSCVEKAAVAAACAGPDRRHSRQRRARLVNITPTAGNISVGRYSSTAVPGRRFATVLALVRQARSG